MKLARNVQKVSMIALVFAITLAANQAAQAALDFTGWDNYGSSNDQGTWVKGGGSGGSTNPYEIFTRSFFYDGSLTGSGFGIDDVIVAIGASDVNGFTSTTSLGATGWKFQMAGFSSSGNWVAGDVATNTNGVSSFSGLGADGAGSFTLQSNVGGSNLGKLTVMQSDGTTLNFTAADSDLIPMFALRGDESLQLFLNLSTIQQYSLDNGTGSIPAFGPTVKTAFYPIDGTLAETLVTISVIPEPASLALLGLGGLLMLRRNRNRSQA